MKGGQIKYMLHRRLNLSSSLASKFLDALHHIIRYDQTFLWQLCNLTRFLNVQVYINLSVWGLRLIMTYNSGQNYSKYSTIFLW